MPGGVVAVAGGDKLARSQLAARLGPVPVEPVAICSQAPSSSFLESQRHRTWGQLRPLPTDDTRGQFSCHSAQLGGVRNQFYGCPEKGNHARARHKQQLNPVVLRDVRLVLAWRMLLLMSAAGRVIPTRRGWGLGVLGLFVS